MHWEITIGNTYYIIYIRHDFNKVLHFWYLINLFQIKIICLVSKMSLADHYLHIVSCVLFLIISKITRYQKKSTQWKFHTFKRLEVTLNIHQTIRKPTKKKKPRVKLFALIKISHQYLNLHYLFTERYKKKPHTQKNMKFSVPRLVTKNKFHPQKITKLSNAPKKMPVEKMNPQKITPHTISGAKFWF